MANGQRWRIVNTWNGGKGGRVVVFVSTEVDDAGHNECFAWVHNNTPFSFSESRRQGLICEQIPAEVAPSVSSDETQKSAPAVLAQMIDALELALATIERLKPARPYDSTQGTRDVINAAIAAGKGAK